MRLNPDLSLVRPWWLRLAVLLIIGFPVFTGWPIELVGRMFAPLFARAGYESDLNTYISVVCAWSLYAALIWLLVYKNVGAATFWDYYVFALILACLAGLLRGEARLG